MASTSFCCGAEVVTADRLGTRKYLTGKDSSGKVIGHWCLKCCNPCTSHGNPVMSFDIEAQKHVKKMKAAMQCAYTVGAACVMLNGHEYERRIETDEDTANCWVLFTGRGVKLAVVYVPMDKLEQLKRDVMTCKIRMLERGRFTKQELMSTTFKAALIDKGILKKRSKTAVAE